MSTLLNRRFAVWVVAAACVACARTPAPDLDAERAALLQTEHDFAAETAARGGDGWADYFMEDGVMFPPSGRVEGREAIREAMRDAFTPGVPSLLWEPETAVVGAAGDVGYTIGRWQSVAKTAAGADTVRATGNYVSFWRKDAGGYWRVAVDIGNRDAAAP